MNESMIDNGPELWRELHHFPSTWDGDPVKAEQFLSGFSARITCCKCRKCWEDMVMNHPMPLSSEAVFWWTVKLHNMVNSKLGKLLFTSEQAQALYPSPPPSVPICIPIHHKGGKFKDNTELRYTLRSIEKHFQGACQVWLVCKKMPEGFEGCHHLFDGGKGLKTALRITSEKHPDGFFWWYDDSVLLLPQTVEDLKTTIASRRWSNAQTGWARQLTKIKERLEAEGYVAHDYSRPHGPYWFDKGMVDEGFADWPNMAAKFPWESWILSKRDWPRRHGNYKQYYGAFKSLPGDRDVLLNFCDGGFTPELKSLLEEFYPKRSTFETGTAIRPKIQVHTIRFGEKWWLQLCSPTLDSWCKRHGHPLKIWTSENINPDYPNSKFCQIDMLRDFVESGDDWMIYVDADVYVDELAPAHPVLSPGFWIREDLPGAGPRDFGRWLRKHKKSSPGWAYRNAGVWMCDRKSAQTLLETISPPYLVGCMEQHQWNWWLSQSAAKGLHVGFLDGAWNSWAFENKKGAFYHIAGKKKSQRVEMFRANGLIPLDPPLQAVAEIPRVFYFEPYRFAKCDSMMAMDEMHIQLLFLAATLETTREKSKRVAVEIGSYRGASTAALIEALNQGYFGHLHVIEIKPTETLRKILAMAKDSSRVTLHTQASWDLDITAADFVFIDGDHKWPAVADTLRAITWGAEVIAMHDSESWPQIPGTWGAKLAAKCLREMPARTVFEDCQLRGGMQTQRGFIVSASSEINVTPLEDFLKLGSSSSSQASFATRLP
jgi:hypothetical protein